MHDILHDTPGFQWALARERLEGRQEGRLEALRETIFAVTQARFPFLVPLLTQQQLGAITDPATLQKLQVQLCLAPNAKEAQQLLLAPHPPLDQPQS